MKIKVINPMKGDIVIQAMSKYCADTGIEDVDFESLTEGPEIIYNRYDVALAGPDTVRKVQKAERDGYDAVTFTCHADPNLAACREGVHIPVLGLLETSAHFCAMLGTRFTILSPNLAIKRWQEENIQKYGLTERLASVRLVKFPIPLDEVLRVASEKPRPKQVDELVEITVAEAAKAVEEDDATAMVFGCGGFLYLEDEVSDRLKAGGYDVLVVNPLLLTIEVAKALAKLGYRHSPAAYPYLEVVAV